MITTPLPILQECSNLLKELSLDESTRRLGYFTTAVQFVLNEHRWKFPLKKVSLTPVAGQQEYDLATLEPHYNPQWGIYLVVKDGDEMTSGDYETALDSSEDFFYLTPDHKKLGFSSDIDGTESIDVWLYTTLLSSDVSSSSDTLPFEIPETVGTLIARYMKYLVHDGKRQRYDARNALLDYKEQLEQLITQSASTKIKGKPKRIPPLMTSLGFTRRYVSG